MFFVRSNSPSASPWITASPLIRKMVNSATLSFESRTNGSITPRIPPTRRPAPESSLLPLHRINCPRRKFRFPPSRSSCRPLPLLLNPSRLPLLKPQLRFQFCRPFRRYQFLRCKSPLLRFKPFLTSRASTPCLAKRNVSPWLAPTPTPSSAIRPLSALVLWILALAASPWTFLPPRDCLTRFSPSFTSRFFPRSASISSASGPSKLTKTPSALVVVSFPKGPLQPAESNRFPLAARKDRLTP